MTASISGGPRMGAGASLVPGDGEATPWRDAPEEVRAMAMAFFEDAVRCEAAGQYDQAFAALERGNAIMRPALGAEAWIAARAQGVGHLKAIFTPAFFAQHVARNAEAAPIFIVGLPRSGSSLVEQILATHPQVQGMGEIAALPAVLQGAYPFDLLGRFDPPAIAADYLRLIRANGWRQKPRFTDKMLSNFTAVGHIHLAFPKAVILHTVREPVDTCLSCYRHIFLQDPQTRFAYDLTDLGRYYRLYREMMDHWRATLMGRVIDIRNEDLVADPEGQTRRLLEVCGLTWDEKCLRFFENPREVATASRYQVRLPIFGDSVGRWRRYRRHLGPLFAALGPYAPPDA